MSLFSRLFVQPENLSVVYGVGASVSLAASTVIQSVSSLPDKVTELSLDSVRIVVMKALLH